VSEALAQQTMFAEVCSAGMGLLTACRVKEDPKTFKAPELAQIAHACHERKFVNRSLNEAIVKNLMALPDEELNPRSAANIFKSCYRLQIQDQAFWDRLVRFIRAIR
jgi:hypothetical protein